ncbi:MAG: molecular chaperone DnaJ [Anaeromyxobacteraceae bacterium]
MEAELCRICGGDGRVGNAFGGSSARCPSCHGTGRRAEASAGFHDVTKTKPSHHRAPAPVATGPKVPVTAQGVLLAAEVSASPSLSADAKSRLLVEIVNHESTHGVCTKTFLKKVRKQLRGAA